MTNKHEYSGQFSENFCQCVSSAKYAKGNEYHSERSEVATQSPQRRGQAFNLSSLDGENVEERIGDVSLRSHDNHWFFWRLLACLANIEK
jgi:hypothetical protein